MSTKTRRSNTRKVVGSLAIAGTAAAVAGLGTFGTFTDSTTPVATTVQTGTLDINLNQPSGAYSIPVTTTNFVPGDSVTRAVNLSNDGSTSLSSVTLTSIATGVPSVLTTDSTNGLQLSLKACSVAWTQGGTASAPVYTCSGTTSTMYSGPAASGNVTLSNPASLTPGGVDNLVFSVSLPTSADNSFQNKSASLSITFTGTQRAAAAK
ncbi:TasA family protein [Petropleomorpha daqingensis]|uniref:Camelysin metallo-endopeptidase n=1 Tax=Petropleomorpha daqingensis TaxID=2026353 RepID=A0A853CH26_9ACTN|nr:TasA family protein [Petropleomorpha daqingensis]NYJ06767.1 hypothetical protein [Petropleomorpha daqingensis]